MGRDGVSMRLFRRVALLALVVTALSLQAAAQACTLWASAGESVAGGGTMIAKNRDWVPDHQQQLRLYSSGGYRYLALYASGNDAQGAKAGVNEKGLVIVSASAPSHLDKKEFFAGRTSMRTLLSSYDSVASALGALKAGKWACGPEFLVLADRKEVACVEFGVGGTYAITGETPSGSVYHTNHYLAPSFLALNQGSQVNSRSRYGKIKGFLQDKDQYGLADFRAFSADPLLWRAGATPTATRTLSAWIVRQPENGPAVLYLKLANPGKPVREYEYTLEELFAGRVNLALIE